MSGPAPRVRRRLKSLRTRIALGFFVCAAGIWAALVAWGAYATLTQGRESMMQELELTSLQVMSLARPMRGHPEALLEAMQEVERVTRASGGDGPISRVRLQIWSEGNPLLRPPELPRVAPQAPGRQTLVLDDEIWWTHTRVDDAHALTVRVSVPSAGIATIDSKQIFFLFLPLIVSLPLLIVPAWVMTRSGLRPLSTMVAQISQRAQSGRLTPLSSSGYRELEPLITSTNDLMSRLQRQLDRERGFVAQVAHEMKTPLAVLRSNLDNLASSRTAEATALAMQDLGAGVRRTDRLVGQLLDLTRMKDDGADLSRKRMADLAEFLRLRIAEFEPVARLRNVSISLDAPERLIAMLDVDGLGAAFDNLLDNAIKFSPKGGSVKITMAHDNVKRTASIEIRDHGPGIEEHLRERAFERFERLGVTTDESDGTGLGLSIVRDACGRIGATLRLTTPTAGNGLAARLAFPLA